MFENYKKDCIICGKKQLSLFMARESIDNYICSNCCKKFNQLNNDYIFSYPINDIKKSILENISIYEIRKNEEKIRKMEQRKQDYIDTLNSMEFIEPIIYGDKVKRKHLKDIPLFTYSQVRKNTPTYKLENFVVIDVETTGLRPATDEILEISAIKFINAQPIKCLSTLVKPKRIIPIEATNINHINNEMVEKSPNIENIIKNFSDFIKGFNIVGYNLDFDLRFLYVNGMDFFNEKRQFYDALDLARKLYKNKLYDCKLDTVAEEMELYRTQGHRATEDAFVTGIIFRDLGNYVKNN